MNKQRLQYLFQKQLAGDISEAEQEELLQLQTDHANKPLMQDVIASHYERAEVKPMDKEAADEILKIILQHKPESKLVPMRKTRFWIWAAAAVIFLVSGVSLYLVLNRSNEKPTIATTPKPIQNDIAPGKEGALLTLADGSTIVLDDLANGKIGSGAVKNGNTLSYKDATATTVTYNTMSTPNRRQYSLVLADGSKVWLNAASSIKFPTAFVGNERQVEITGEAYFEIAKNARKPFIVVVGGMNVQVLGTHFNINSYSDEDATKTTLLEGSVKITAANKEVIIKPGEQAVSYGGNLANLNVLKGVDVNAVIAWKTGYFSFKNSSLPTVMRQIARWYDVEIVYEGTIPNRIFGGRISRSNNASQVLKVLEESDVHFRIEGKKIIVKP